MFSTKKNCVKYSVLNCVWYFITRAGVIGPYLSCSPLDRPPGGLKVCNSMSDEIATCKGQTGLEVLKSNNVLSMCAGCLSAELMIMPGAAVQAKPVGKKVLLTCRAQDDRGLISQLEWRDPSGNVIKNDNQ